MRSDFNYWEYIFQSYQYEIHFFMSISKISIRLQSKDEKK